MLHVAFWKLARRRKQQVGSHLRGRGVHQRHHVLQLVAEAECAAGLVEGRARPEAAREHLIQQPAVGEQVQRGVWRVHLQDTQRALPVVPHGVERLNGGLRTAPTSGQRAGFLDRRASAEAEDDGARLAGGQVERHLDRCAWIERGTHQAIQAWL